MDLVVNHTSDEHAVVPGVARPRRRRSATGTGGGRPARASRAARRAPSRTTGSRRSPAPPGSTTSAAASTSCTSSARKQPDLNWENPEVRQAVYAMMRRWVERGVDGFRMDVINLISKDPSLPGRRRSPEGRSYALGVRVRGQRPAAARVPRRDEPRGRARPSSTCSRSGRCRAARSSWPATSPTPQRGELNMVFTFEHVGLDEQPGLGKWALARPAAAGAEGRTSTPGSAVSPTSGGTRCTSTTTTSRAPSPASATTAPSTGSPRPRRSATVLHLHRGTPYVYQGEELGMTNSGFTAHRAVPRHRGGQLLRRRDRALGRVELETVLESLVGQGPRQRAHPDALGRLRARRLHDR